MKETKTFCDKCKKELLWSENYLIVTIDNHLANTSYSGLTIKEYHYHPKCLTL